MIGDYIWQISFSHDLSLESQIAPEIIVINESEPDFKEVCETNKKNLTVAILYRLEDMEPIHALNLESYELKKVFRRRELDMATRRDKTIPVIEAVKDGQSIFCFAYPDTVVFTHDRKFHREDW
jgi:hypothetical protein